MTVVRDGGAGLIDLSARGRIRVSGSEATMFLNGLITNDMKTLAREPLDAGGVSDRAGTFDWRGACRSRGNDLRFSSTPMLHRTRQCLKTISRFTLAGDFKVSDVTAETALLTVQGKRAAEVVEKVFETIVSDLPRNGVVETEWQNVPVTIIRATHTG